MVPSFIFLCYRSPCASSLYNSTLSFLLSYDIPMPLEYPHFTLFHLIHLISLHFLIYNLSLHIITPSTTSSHPLSSYHHHYLFFLALSGGQDLDPTEPKSLDNSGSSWTQTTLQVCYAVVPFPLQFKRPLLIHYLFSYLYSYFYSSSFTSYLYFCLQQSFT